MKILQSLLKNSIYIVITIIFAALITTFIKSPLMVQVKTSEIKRGYGLDFPISPKYSPVIKYVIGDGQCSGVIIDAHYALTAGHCVTDWFGKMLSSRASIRGTYSEVIGTAYPIAVDRNRDVAILKGNFNNFQYVNVDFDGDTIRDITSQHIVSCGFPAGGEMFCSLQKLIGNKYFMLKGYGGIVQKGQSGGPVIDVDSGLVIGVISGVDKDFNIFGPVLGVKETFGL